MKTFLSSNTSLVDQLANDQFKGYLKFILPVASFLCILSVLLLLGSIYLSIIFKLEVFILIAIISGLAILLGVSTFLWSAKTKSQQRKNKQSKGYFSMILYQISVFIIVSLIFCGILVSLIFINGKMLANETESSDDFFENIVLLQKSLIGYFILSFFVIFCCGYIAYVVFICSNPSDNLKNTLNFWAFILILFSSAGILFYEKSKNQGGYLIVKEIMDQKVLDFGLVACLLSGLTVIIGYFINLGKWRRPYIFFGGAFIWVVMIALLAAGFNFRNANSVFKSTLDNCSSILHSNNVEEISKLGCQKYKVFQMNSKTYFSQNCQSNDLAIIWEDDKSKDISQKTRKFSCVNKSCCSKIIPEFSFVFFVFSSQLLGVFLSGFLVLTSALILSEKADITKNSGIKDYLIGGLIGAAVLVFALLLVFYSPNIHKEKTIIIAAENTNESSTNIHKIDINENPKSLKDYPSKFCTLFSKLYSEYNDIIKDLNSPQSSTYRIVINGVNGKFKLPRDYNSDKIFRFTKKDKKSFFPNSTEIDSFFAFQGNVTNMKSFLENDLNFCFSPDKVYSFKVYRYFKPDTTSALMSLEENKTFDNSKASQESLFPETSYEETIPSENWEKLYNTKFSNLIIRTLNVTANSPISGVELRLFKGIQPCLESMSEPMRATISKKNGTAVFHNLANQHYTIFADAKGFKSNCFTVKSFKRKENLEIDIPLLPEFTGKPVEILLHYYPEEAQLLLHSTFNFNNKLVCSSSPMGKKCGGMNSIAIKDTQLISFSDIGKYDYLFFLQRVPKKEEEKKVLSQYLSGENVKLLNANKELETSEANVKIFVDNLIYPVFDFEIPILSDEQNKEPNLIWLLGCMDGKVGPSTLREINKFWFPPAQGTTPQYWNREGQSFLPNGNICTNFYKSNANN